MERKRRKIIYWLGGILAAALLAGTGRTTAAAEGFEIEQVQANMPEVQVYLRSETQPEAGDYQVTLGQQVLSGKSVVRFAETGNAVDYFILVDVSNSMPDEYCLSIKDALVQFSAQLREQDKMILLSFGETVDTLLEGSESAAQREEAVQTLHNTDRKTLLFEAVFRTADIADKMQDMNRKIVLVISDGEDFAVGASTGEEAIAALNDRNMPLYAMGISDTAKENLNKFGETARTLGGTLSIFTPDETEDTLNLLQEVWNDTWVLKAKAENNRIDNQKWRLTVKQISTGINRSRDVLLTRYQRDVEMPYITTVEKTGESQLTVYFNKKVTGAENSAAWNIQCDGQVLPVTTAVYREGEEIAVQLNFERELYTGSYTISAPAVTDLSMEQNPVRDSFETDIEGLESEKEAAAWQVFLEKWWWTILIGFVVLLILVLVIIWYKIKKNKGIVYVEGKAALVSNVEQRQRVEVLRKEGLPITLEFVGGTDEGMKKVEAKIDGSLIVGRSPICELSLNDKKMSRQHFALEYKNGEVFITDLGTTNGTAVNGVAVNKMSKLKPRDVITAGSLQMRINW